MKPAAIEKAAQTLWTTWQSGGQVEALADDCRPATRLEGYAIQAQIAHLSGQKVFGRKIAATSTAGQRHIGVDGPLSGRLLEKRVSQSGARVSLANNIMNVAEAEFAFRMQRDLPPRKTPYSIEEVVDAVGSLHPAIEIPDSRYANFVSVGAAQLIADNACACFFVIGPAVVVDWRQHDLSRHTVSAQINGKVTCTGIGENVLGDPRIALAWIANELSLTGDTLRAGETVTTGTCIVPAAIAPGDHIVADFGLFGRVEAHLTA